MLQHSPAESRLGYVACAVATMVLGLAVVRFGHSMQPGVRDKLGDALWASMIFWWIGAAMPRVGVWSRAGVALGICVAVEFSQLYHAPGIDALRRMTLGHLVLGNGFDSLDLAAYTVGVIVAVTLERLVRRAT